MNLQQLEYILALDRHRHFARAASDSFVTQPTLSMMVRKLEEELGIEIFDRTRQPLVPTKEGEEIIRRAGHILAEVDRLRDFALEMKEGITGEFRLGIIPTLAPYLLPLFLGPFGKKFPSMKLFIREAVTNDIIRQLKSGELDAGLAATPLHEDQLEEHPLFKEEFYAYASKSEKLPAKKYILPKEIDIHHLWLLQEGHCLRNQVFNLCELKKQDTESEHVAYEAGSIETLINLVDRYQGITIIPELATLKLSAQQKKNVREFANPKPVREISLVVMKNFPRKKFLQAVKDEIISAVPLEKRKSQIKVLDIE